MLKIALLVIDMQKGFIQGKELGERATQASEYINEVAGYLRTNGHYVFIVQDVEVEGGIESSSFEVIPEIQQAESDIRITKEWSNSFWKTDLEQQLRDKQVEVIIVAGYAAEHCVLFTYNGAMERGFTTAVLQNGVLSQHASAIKSMYRDRHVISYPIIEIMAKY